MVTPLGFFWQIRIWKFLNFSQIQEKGRGREKEKEKEKEEEKERGEREVRNMQSEGHLKNSKNQ